MTLENIIENAGCKPPFIMAQNMPTTKYGHSDEFNFRICQKETGGTSSS